MKNVADEIEFAFYTLQIRDALMEVIGVERLAIGTKVPKGLDCSLPFALILLPGFRNFRCPCDCNDW